MRRMPDLTHVKRRWQPIGHLWPILARRLPWACRRGLRLVCRLGLGGAARRTKFTNVAGDYATVLQNGLDEYLGKIVAVRAFYDASVEVDPDEFDLFTSQILAGYERRHAARLVCRASPAMSAPSSSARRGKGDTADFSIRTWSLARSDGGLARARRVLSRSLFDRRLQTGGDAWASTSIPSRSEAEAIRRARDGNIMATAQSIQLRNPIGGEREGFSLLSRSIARIPN